VVATDLDPARAAGLPATVLPDATAVCAAADVVVLATWSRQPLLDAASARPGQQLTTLGADEPGKIELSRDLLAASRVIVDDIPLAATMGPLANVGLGAEACAGTLGQILRGELAGVENGDRPTVYAPVGLPWQDLALSWPVDQYARQAGLGQRVDLLS
jgi:ornithine cyclodeaminase/alanine dehydrogenase-like protein (mu-crystallin family)